MIVCAVVLFVLCVYKVKFAKFHCDYISMEQTSAIKVFCSRDFSVAYSAVFWNVFLQIRS